MSDAKTRWRWLSALDLGAVEPGLASTLKVSGTDPSLSWSSSAIGDLTRYGRFARQSSLKYSLGRRRR